MDITLENKKYILRELNMMNEDLKICKSQQTYILLTKQIELFEKELLKYRKPVLISPPYEEDNIIYKIEYVDFTDDELTDKDFVKNYLQHTSDTLVGINNSFKRSAGI